MIAGRHLLFNIKIYKNMTTKNKQGRPKKTGNSVIRQHNVGVPEYMMEQIVDKGKINQISFSGYVRTLIENDLKDIPVLL
jgi:hypothetical protein